jgi:EKC/KEOPS complex subunit CGI121/TPRKB
MTVTDDVLATLTDWPRVRKYYKLNGLVRLDRLDEKAKKAEGEVLVLGAMALKGA